jgi:pyrimidine deaminase RibD-like protein
MKCLNRAKRLAAESTQHFKHSAIVFVGGAVIAEATNSSLAHAEVRALREAGSVNGRHVTVLSIRVTPDGKLKCAKPCDHCLAYMMAWGVKTVLYSTASGQIERLRLRGIHE